MIELLTYKNQIEKNEYLKGCDFNEHTLLVSDLDSKFYWQKQLIKKNGYFAGSSVLRVEDFWKLLIQRNFTQLSFVSRSWVDSYIKEKLSNGIGTQFGLPYAKLTTTIKSLNEFLPIVCHPDSDEIMENWWEQNKNKNISWKPWFLLSNYLWNDLSQTNCILSDWSASYLVHNNPFKHRGTKDLIVDLGSEIRPIEVELLQFVSTQFKVKVLMPSIKLMDSYQWVSFAYKLFFNRSYSIAEISKSAKNNNVQNDSKGMESQSPSFKRFTTCLAEVKFAMSTIQQWCKKGILLSEIAIIAPELEYYWPVLSWHLKKENLLYEKSERVKIGNLGTVINWLAKLKKFYLSEISFTEFELAEFHPSSDSNTYSSSQFLKEWSKWTIKNKIPNSTLELSKFDSKKINATEFIQSALALIPSFDEEEQKINLIEFIKKWLLEANTLGVQFIKEWIVYLEGFLHYQEVELASRSNEGLGVYSLSSALPIERKKQIYIGCSEEQLKSSQGMVSGADILSLLYHTGHLLSHPDREIKEFQLKFLQDPTSEQIYTFAEYDFNGKELVPSVFWLKGKELCGEGLTHIDSWTLSHWENEQFKKRNSLVNKTNPNNDYGNRNLETDKTGWIPTLSPSSLKTYVECPFKFFVEKGLGLINPEIIDLDLDPRTQGSLQHHLLEELVREPFDVIELNRQLPDIVNALLNQRSDQFYSEHTKEIIKKDLLRLGKQFLENESIYRQKFPQFYTQACEAWFVKEYEIDKKRIKYRGKIDRIDRSKDHKLSIVLDYKNDVSSFRNALSWIENLEFQLPSYVSSLEQGCVSAGRIEDQEDLKIEPSPVVAAHYYGLKDFKRKGFTLNNLENGIVITPTSNSLITMEEKEKIINDLDEIILSSANKILKGDFRALPHPKVECQKCYWRYLCRTETPNL